MIENIKETKEVRHEAYEQIMNGNWRADIRAEFMKAFALLSIAETFANTKCKEETKCQKNNGN